MTDNDKVGRDTGCKGIIDKEANCNGYPDKKTFRSDCKTPTFR